MELARAAQKLAALIAAFEMSSHCRQLGDSRNEVGEVAWDKEDDEGHDDDDMGASEAFVKRPKPIMIHYDLNHLYHPLLHNGWYNINEEEYVPSLRMTEEVKIDPLLESETGGYQPELGEHQHRRPRPPRVVDLVALEPRLLTKDLADPCEIVQALVRVTGFTPQTVLSMVLRRPSLLVVPQRFHQREVKRREGKGGSQEDASFEETNISEMEVASQVDGIEDKSYASAFASSLAMLGDILDSPCSPSLLTPSFHRPPLTPFPLTNEDIIQTNAALKMVRREPHLLTISPGALQASANAIVRSFPSLLHHRKGESADHQLMHHSKRRMLGHQPLPQQSISLTDLMSPPLHPPQSPPLPQSGPTKPLRDMLERCPELLCSSPGAIQSSCTRLRKLLLRSKVWSSHLKSLVERPRNLAVALSYGIDASSRYDRLDYLVSTNRDKGMGFKEALVIDDEDFEEVWIGYREWRRLRTSAADFN